MDNFTCYHENLSEENVTKEVWAFTPGVPNIEAARNSIIVIVFLLMISGLLWNVLILIVMAKRRLYTNRPTVLLLINLTIINLFICVFILPFNAAAGIMKEFSFGGSDTTRCAVCKIGVTYIIAIFATLTNLTLLSIDRLIFIKLAIKYDTLITNKKMMIAIVLAWIYSIAISLPALFGFGEILFSTTIGLCIINTSGKSPYVKNKHYLIFISIATLLPLTVLIIANTWVLCTAQKYIIKRYINKYQNRGNKLSTYSTAQVNLIKVYTAVFLICLVTWFPIILRLFLGIASDKTRHTTKVQVIGIIAHLALLSQVLLQPMLQALLFRGIREEMNNWLKKMKALLTK